MLRLDDYAMYSLKRIFDMRNQVLALSEETPLLLREDMINLIGSILMIESNLVPYIINLAGGDINAQMSAFTQDVLHQAGWRSCWYLEIDKEILDDITAQHTAAQEKGHTSIPDTTKDRKMLFQYGYPPAVIIRELYQAGLETKRK